MGTRMGNSDKLKKKQLENPTSCLLIKVGYDRHIISKSLILRRLNNIVLMILKLQTSLADWSTSQKFKIC